ncbi:MAG: hypothetical protein ACUVWK_01905 [Nitrososphaerales archaeon]
MNFDEPKTVALSVALFNLMVGAYSVKEIMNLIKRNGFVKVRELQMPHRTHSILFAEKPEL